MASDHNRDKERAYPDFMLLVRKSWTYAKLTAAETERLLHAIDFAKDHCTSGTYYQRWDTFNAVYVAFLAGLGYTNQLHWRDA